MKTLMTKCLSCILVMTIIFGMGSFAAMADYNVYPESEHNYQNDFEYIWYYEYDKDVRGLYVTFSEKTSFEEPTLKFYPIESGPLSEILGGGFYGKVKNGDSITVTAKDDYSVSATGKEFSGKTIYIPGNSFSIKMTTDSDVTDYGFSIDKISEYPPEDMIVITYECCDLCGESKLECYNEGDEIKVNSEYSCNTGDSAFIGWISDSGEEYYPGDTIECKSTTLTAKKVPLLLKHYEGLNFYNSDGYFDIDENGGYDISEEDYKTMQKNTYKVFGIGVLPAVGLSVALATYPGWEWLGSCYGMSTVVFLNHYGMINALERDQNAKSVSELKNDTDIISMINYYQWSAAGSFLCENFALKQGSKMYSQQLKDVYESVADGNIVLFTFYSGEMFKTNGHTVLFTGAYTQADGTKVLVAYDSNYGKEYCAEEYEQRFYIDKDFTTIKRATQYPVDRYMDIGAFNWTDDYKHFEAFDINGGGRVFTWYSHYFSQLGRLLKTWISLIKL